MKQKQFVFALSCSVWMMKSMASSIQITRPAAVQFKRAASC